MPYVSGSTLEFVHNSTYLLREGGSVTVKLTAGVGVPYNVDEVVATRVTVWSNTGNVYVGDDGDLITPLSNVIPTATAGPYQIGDEKRTVVVYDGQPDSDNPWSWDVQLRARPWAYSDEQVFFKVELLKANEAVYADNSREVNGRVVYPHVNVRLVTTAGRTEEPGDPTGVMCKALGSTANLVVWTTDVPATETEVYTSATEAGSKTLVATAGVGTNAWYVHDGLMADTTYHYHVRAVNDEGNSDYVYVGSARTLATPAVPSAPEVTQVLSPNESTVVVHFEHSDEVADTSGAGFPNTYTCYLRETADADVEASYQTRQVDDTRNVVKFTGLTENTSYTLYMTATNDGGESADGSDHVIVTAAGPANPVQPTNVTVTTTDYVNQTVSWDMTTSNEVGFGLYYSTDQTTWTPVQSDAPLPAGTRSWTQTGLEPDTTYYWRVFSFNYVDGTLTKSDYTQASGDTDAVPTQPGQVQNLAGWSGNNTSLVVYWQAPATGTAIGFKIYRSATEGGSYTLQGEVPANRLYWGHGGLSANTVYWYRVDSVGYDGDVTGPTVSVATLYQSQSIQPVSGFSVHEDSRNRIKEVSGRAIITSDRDRWIVRVGTSWYKAGLRPIRGTVGLAGGTGGVIEDGVYSVYLVLVRGETRSVPSAASAEVTLDGGDNGKLIVTPPLNADEDAVECRDIGFDLNGNTIAGADAWEIYVYEQNEGVAYRIARLPLAVADWEDTPGSGTYTISMSKFEMFDGTRRPMEVLGESSLPPACWEAEVLDNRVVCTGDTIDIEPTAAELTAGAKISITAGNDYFTVTGWNPGDACIYKKLVVEDLDTGWEVWDYDDTNGDGVVTKCYIRHKDANTNDGGWNGETGDITDFVLKAEKNRVYFSAYFSGEAGGFPSYSPETFPPLTVAENEFFPDDNAPVNCLVAVGEVLLAAKPERWIVMSGGNAPDTLDIQTRVISRGSGLNASFSVARDANDNVFYLGDTGPFMVTAGGVQKMNITFGNGRLFQEVFDISSVPNAKGSWFSREDWYVVTGLNRKGRSGNRDGFVCDVKNGAILPFSTPYEFTHIKEYKSSTGEFQLMFGAEQGKLGYHFKSGLFVDGADYTQTYALGDAEPIVSKVRTGVVDTEESMTPRWIQPRVKSMPRDARFEIGVEFDDKTRCSDPTEFDAVTYVDFTTDDDGSHVSVASFRADQLQMEITGTTSLENPNAYYEIKELCMEAIIRDAS